MEPINWKMVSHPMNWITFMLMVIIAGAIGHLLLSYFDIEPQVKGKLGYAAMPAGQSPGEVPSGAITPQGTEQFTSWGGVA